MKTAQLSPPRRGGASALAEQLPFTSDHFPGAGASHMLPRLWGHRGSAGKLHPARAGADPGAAPPTPPPLRPVGGSARGTLSSHLRPHRPRPWAGNHSPPQDPSLGNRHQAEKGLPAGAPSTPPWGQVTHVGPSAQKLPGLLGRGQAHHALQLCCPSPPPPLA